MDLYNLQIHKCMFACAIIDKPSERQYGRSYCCGILSQRALSDYHIYCAVFHLIASYLFYQFIPKITGLLHDASRQDNHLRIQNVQAVCNPDTQILYGLLYNLLRRCISGLCRLEYVLCFYFLQLFRRRTE